MRIHEGDYAYEIRQNRDPMTQLVTSWAYAVYRVRPVDHLIEKGEVETQRASEEKARAKISQLLAHPDSQVA